MMARRILLDLWEVRAFLAGRKTRITLPRKQAHPRPIKWDKLRPGDLLWCAEPFIEFVGVKDQARRDFVYAADYSIAIATPPPSMKGVHHKQQRCDADLMHASASRLVLFVDDVKRSDLFSTSDADAIAEGITPALGGWSIDPGDIRAADSSRRAFLDAWRKPYGRGFNTPVGSTDVVVAQVRCEQVNIKTIAVLKPGEAA